MPAIAIRHLSKTFEQKGNSVEALRDISLDIEEGDIYGIIGMSGAGKSTLVRCLNYLERPTGGEVIIGGRDLGTLTEKELREQRSDIAMIFQHFNLLMQKSVLDNVCFPMQICRNARLRQNLIPICHKHNRVHVRHNRIGWIRQTVLFLHIHSSVPHAHRKKHISEPFFRFDSPVPQILLADVNPHLHGV